MWIKNKPEFSPFLLQIVVRTEVNVPSLLNNKQNLPFPLTPHPILAPFRQFYQYLKQHFFLSDSFFPVVSFDDSVFSLYNKIFYWILSGIPSL